MTFRAGPSPGLSTGLSFEPSETANWNEPLVVTTARSLNVGELDIRFVAVRLVLLLEGRNLGTTGPLVPAIRKCNDVYFRSLAQTVFRLSGSGQVNHALISMVPLV